MMKTVIKYYNKQLNSWSLMSYKSIKLKQANKKQTPHARSYSQINHQEFKQLHTFLNVSYTDYCGLSFKKKASSGSKFVVNGKKKISQFWRNSKRQELTMQKGDSFRVQPIQLHQNSSRPRPQRMNTDYYQKNHRSIQAKSLYEFYRVYELQFLQKKTAILQAEGHKLKIAKLNQIKPKMLSRPITAYLKRNHHINIVDNRKIKTFDLKNNKRQSQNAIKGWQNDTSENQMV